MMLSLNLLSSMVRVCGHLRARPANLESILRIQQRAARVILNAPFNSRSVDLFNTLNWIPFYRESHINQCALIYKRLQGNTPNYLNELLVINSNMHTRNTKLICFVLDIVMLRRVVVLLSLFY